MNKYAKPVSFVLIALTFFIFSACNLSNDANYVGKINRTSVVSSKAENSAETLILEGITALEQKEFTTARAKFTAALALDPLNEEAKIWKALLDLAATVVDQNIVDLMQGNFGILGYPTSIDTLLSDTWFSSQWYESKSGFVAIPQNDIAREIYIRGNLNTSVRTLNYYHYCDPADPNTEYYNNYEFSPSDSGSVYRLYNVYNADVPEGYTHYKRITNIADTTKPSFLMPDIKSPTWIPRLATDEARNLHNLPFFIIANVLDGNPTGFNQIIDRVLAGSFGTNFDSLITTVRDLNPDSYIKIPDSLIQAYSGDALGFDIYLGKGELLVLAGQLQLIKSLVQYVASYDLSYPLSLGQFDWYDMINGTILDADDNNFPDVIDALIESGQLPGVFVSDLLKARNINTRNASKNTMAKGLNDLYNASSMIVEYLDLGYYDDFLTADEASTISGDIEEYSHYVDEMRDSVENGVPLIINEDGWQVTVFPGSLFSNAALNLRNNVEYDSATGKPVIYKLYQLSNNSEKILPASKAQPANSTWTGIAIQVHWSGLNSVYPALASMLYKSSAFEDQNCYVKAYTEAAWNPDGATEKLAAWLFGM